MPLAAVIGILMYIRLETMLPVGLALQSAGVAIGPIFALMIGGAGASPPEVSMLAAVFKPRLLIGSSSFGVRSECEAFGVGRYNM